MKALQRTMLRSKCVHVVFLGYSQRVVPATVTLVQSLPEESVQVATEVSKRIFQGRHSQLQVRSLLYYLHISAKENGKRSILVGMVGFKNDK